MNKQLLNNTTNDIFFLFNIKLYDYFKNNNFNPIIDNSTDENGKFMRECVKDSFKPCYKYLRTQKLIECLGNIDWNKVE